MHSSQQEDSTSDISKKERKCKVKTRREAKCITLVSCAAYKMAMSNLSVDGEFRYIIQWFNEWSELQRDDFVPVLVEYLLRGTPSEVYMNGMINSVSTVDIADKPMSLFQCRIKLFREWNKKWPLEFKHKLKEKIIEIDPKVGEKIVDELKSDESGGTENSVTNGDCNGDRTAVIEVAADVPAEPLNAEGIMSVAAAIVEATEEVYLDSRLVAVLNNETPVDDNDPEQHVVSSATMIPDDTHPQAEPAEQVQMQTQMLQPQIQVQEENAGTVTVA